MAIDLDSGKVLWDTHLSQMADGAATVSGDLVFTTTFDGYLLALEREHGRVVWRKKLPAFTNAPIAVDGDRLVTAASYPGGKGQIPEVIAFRLGAHGSITPTHGGASSSGSAAGFADGAVVFSTNCSSCHTLAAAPDGSA